MKKTYLFFLTVAVVTFCLPTRAQVVGFSHTVSVVGTVPTGSFGRSIDLNPGYPVYERDQIGKDAALGLGLTYRIGKSFDVILGDLMPFAEVGFFWNRVGSSHRDAFDDQRAKAPVYKNVPMMIGVQYRHDLLPLIKPYVELAFGFDWFFPGRTGDSDKATGNPYFVYKSDFASAWQFGVGTYIGGKVSAGLTYYGFGKHDIDFNTKRSQVGTTSGPVSNATTEFRKVQALALKLSFHF